MTSIARLYEKNAFMLPPMKSLIRQKIMKGDFVVDAGCGTGVYSDILRKKVGERGKLLAVDRDKSMVQYCKKKHPDVETKQLEIEKLSRIVKNADVVFASLVLQFSRPEAIAEIRKVLKKGGKLIFSIPLYRTGINIAIDKQTKNFMDELISRMNEQAKNIGCNKKVAVEYSNTREQQLRKLLNKSRFRILEWVVVPVEKSDFNFMKEYYKIPWRSRKMLDLPFRLRYKIITDAMKLAFKKYPKFMITRYYLFGVAQK
ncbi:class I SAM-dependent methyltransferase [Candidatus Woesearchaeota archaeon]|nr:class I SAM-dependent methyltransferase [Candidatus Woesearchaeota archaeon]